MPEEEQRPGPRSEQTTVLSAPQPVDEPTAEDGTPATGRIDSQTEQLAVRAGVDPHTRQTTAEEQPAPEPATPEAPAAAEQPLAAQPGEPAQTEETPEPAEAAPAAAEPEPRVTSAPPPNPPVQPEPLTRGLFAPIRPAEPAQPYPSLRDNQAEQNAPQSGPAAPPQGTQRPGTPLGFPGAQEQGTPPQNVAGPGRQGPGTPPQGFAAPGAATQFFSAPGTPQGEGAGTPPRGVAAQGAAPGGADRQGLGMPPRGLDGQDNQPGTPPRGFEAQANQPGSDRHGTPPRGFGAQDSERPGTPPRGFEAQANQSGSDRPNTPPRGFPALGSQPGGDRPGTPPRGFEAQANQSGSDRPNTPPRGFPALGSQPGGDRPGTPPRGFAGPGTPPRGFDGLNAPTQHVPDQAPGTPGRGFAALGTPGRGFAALGTPPQPRPRPGEQTTQSIDAPTQNISAQNISAQNRSVDQPTSRIEQATQHIPRPLGAPRQPDPEVDTVQIPKIEAATSFLPTPVRDAEATVVAALPPTPPGGSGEDFGDGEDGERKNQRKRRTIIGVAAAFGVFGLLYGVDLLLSQGNVPRGVAVAGVDVGGLDRAAAEAKLRQQIEPRLTKPVTVRAGDVEASVNPQDAGLTMDWAATLDQAGAQPLNPFTRLSSFFGSRDVGVVTRSDGPKLTSALENLRGKTDREPVEGTVRFQNAKPVAVDPKAGQKLDVEKASAAMVADWADGKVVELPISGSPVKSTPESVRKALEEIAKPAVSGPVVVQGEGKNANITPAAIANSLKFEVDEGGNLAPKLDNGKVVEQAKQQLASTEKPGKDATFVLEGGKPVVKESADGRGVDWEKTLTGLPEVLRRTDNRTIKAEYGDQPAKLTTEQANQLGVVEMISRFETKGFASDSGQNIRRAAEQINGAVVKPGETFSLNARTGPRNQSTGYVEAGILEHGLPGRGVGGGVSQMATTLYNAAYYAGMVDVEHKEHSNYISRYPAGREATVFQGPNGQSLIDVKFKNDTKTGIFIQTIWTSNSIAVQLWGTKTYEVQGQEGQRTNVTQPNTRNVTDKPDCKASGGLEGFTITDTRTIKELATGKTRTERRTVTYKAQDKIVCGPPTP